MNYLQKYENNYNRTKKIDKKCNCFKNVVSGSGRTKESYSKKLFAKFERIPRRFTERFNATNFAEIY